MHEPVLIDEVIELLSVSPGGVYVDGTVGSAGHAEAILKGIGRDGFLLGIDRDEAAVARSRVRLSGFEPGCALVQGDFEDIAEIAAEAGIREIDGIILDLGVSSEQLEGDDRGFGFLTDGPLDMRMDRSRGETAAELIARIDEGDMVQVLREYGEERQARRIVRAVIAERERQPITGTRQLADLVERTIGRRGKRHPATRTFQALRIAVNDELGALARGLEAALDLVKQGGRVAVISFHSLEDRIVKRCFVAHAGRWESLQEGGQAWRGREPVVRVLTKKPRVPCDEEVARNPRARSAKLRVAEKTG